MDGFAIRLLAAGLATGASLVAWRVLRPSRAHISCALAAACSGALGDWWVESLIAAAGIWQHTGGRDGFSLQGVPLEMPLAFIPAGAAGLWCLALGSRVPSRLSPAGFAAALYLGWCLLGIGMDLLNLGTGAGMHSARPLPELAVSYVLPFWVLVSAVPFFFYWVLLKLVDPRLSVLDLRGVPGQ